MAAGLFLLASGDMVLPGAENGRRYLLSIKKVSMPLDAAGQDCVKVEEWHSVGPCHSDRSEESRP
jgi:hypothetical protein